MSEDNKNNSFAVSGSRLIYSKKKKSKIICDIFIKTVNVVLLIGIMLLICYGFIELFNLDPNCQIEQKIGYCSAIVTFASAVITIATLTADQQIRIYDDSLNIFNDLRAKNSREQSSSYTQPHSQQEMPLRRWYFIKKFKTYFLKNKKKLYSQTSDANITFYFDNKSKKQNSNNWVAFNIPLTKSEWQFFNVAINYIRMLHYQKYCLFEYYSEKNKTGLLMWETVLSLYKSVLINITMNTIRIINILSIPAVIIIACFV